MADDKRDNLISPRTADALIAAHDGDMALCMRSFPAMTLWSFP